MLVLQSSGRPIQDRARVPTSLTALSCDEASGDVRVDVVSRAEVSVRGNSSYFYDKKSYRLELQDARGRDRRVGLLGMAPDADWVLYAGATDRSFARSVLAHELWRGMGHYAVRWRFVELFVVTNGPAEIPPGQLVDAVPRALDAWSRANLLARADVNPPGSDSVETTLARSYVGLYVLMEKIKRGPGRLDIARLRPRDDAEPAISGGYIIKKDDQGRGERGLLTGQEFRLRFEEPRESELTPAHRFWMTQYLDALERALFGRNFRDPIAGYPAYLEVESFVDFHWLVEVAKNADGYWYSQYMHKDRGGKLAMGPVWDWDNAFANPFFGRHATNGWRFEAAMDPDYTWYRRLFEDPDFLQRYVDRWSELRTHLLSTTNVIALLDGITTGLEEAHQRNGNRWERAGGNAVLRARYGLTLANEVQALKDWLVSRLMWIDSQDYPRPVAHVSSGARGVIRISMAGLAGRIYYTTDGADPRARGSAPSPTAAEYREPIELMATNRVLRIRARSEFGLWSAPVVVELPTP